MNLENEACLVLASSQGTISDIKTSLGLLKMVVKGASDAPNAKAELLSGDKPVIALVEKDLPGKPDEGMKVADSIKTHPDLSGIPVCLLSEDFEEGDPIPEHFDGVFRIPVEFPTFTREVRKFFDGFDGEVVAARDEASAVPRPSEAIPVADANGSGSVEVSAEVSESDVDPARVEVSARRLLDRRLVVAYGIQLAVLDELERDAEFSGATAGDIPKLVAKVTQNVAQQFDIDEFIGKTENEEHLD